MIEQLEGRALLSHSSQLAHGLGAIPPAGSHPALLAQTPDPSLPTLAASPITIRSTLPPALVSGAPATGTVTLRITPQSSVILNGRVTIAVFTSSAASLDASSVQLGEQVRRVHLAAGHGFTAAVPLQAGAGAIPTGYFNLVAAVTDPDGATDYTALDRTVNVGPPLVSLRESIEKTSLPAPHGFVAIKVTNFGNTTTSGTTTCALYATATDNIYSSPTTLISSVDLPLRIKPGRTARVRIPYHSIPALSPGKHGAVVQLSDSDERVPVYVIITA